MTEGALPPGPVIGLDPGERRVGVAVSDPERRIAFPRDVWDRREVDLHEELRSLVDETGAVVVVIGLPVGMSGREGPAARAARAFGEEIAKVIGLPVRYADERLTSVTAERVLLEADVSRRDRRSVKDKLEAAIMLQSFLDRDRHRDTGGTPDE